jgi:DNA-binding transcriptional ArsR family regulator
LPSCHRRSFGASRPPSGWGGPPSTRQDRARAVARPPLRARLDASFAALSDLTRRGVLEQLGRADASITDLAEKFHMTLTGMKKHVGVLEQAGLVTTEKVGRVRTFEEKDGKTVLVVHDLYPAKEALDDAIGSGMEGGMLEAPEQLDELLVALPRLTT